MKNKRLIEIILYGALIFIMVLSLNLAAGDSTGMNISFVKILFLSLIMVVLVIGFMRYPLITAGALILLAPIVLLLNIHDSLAFIRSIPGFAAWLPGYIIGYNYFDMNYSVIFAVLYTLLITVFLTVTAFNSKVRFLPILGGIALLTFFWFVYVEKARLYMMIYLFAAVPLYAHGLYRQKLKEWEKAGSTVASNVGLFWTVNAALVIALSIGLSMFLPLNIRPMQAVWLNEKMLGIFPFISEWRNDSMESFGYGFGSRYDLSMTGFKGGKSSKLGGPVSLDDSVLFTIDVNDYSNLYLRGAVKDNYTGTSWFKSATDYKTVKPDEKLNMDPEIKSTLYYLKIRVTPKKLMTSTIFAPNHINMVHNEKEYRFFINNEMDAFFPKVVTKNSYYEVESVIPYVNIPELRQIDVKAGAPAAYLELPTGFSDRVQKLAEQITAGYDNDYDKIKAIESYLRKNYKYTLKPSRIPRGRELVDYFLFEEKQGYCAYYATSMAMMLRSIGIPCRYVEGFLAKPERSATRNIRGTDAHAWVEVNFGKFGWLTFEPTAAYDTVDYRQYTVVSQTTPKPQKTDGTIPVTAQIGKLSGNAKDKELREFEDGETLTKDSADKTPQAKKMSGGMMILLGFLTLLLLRILTRHIGETISEIRLRTSKGRQYAVRYFKEISWYFGKMAIKTQKDETIREFMRKIQNQFGDESRETEAVTNILEKMRYSEKEINGEEKNILERFRKSTRTLAVQRLSGVLVFIYLYIIGRRW